MSRYQTWRDDPIKSLADDEIGRGHLVKRTAELVRETHSWDSSVVLALVGQWGSGKSSVLELTVEELIGTDPGFKVVRFTPWATGDTNGLLAEFHAAVAAALPEDKFNTFRLKFADIIAVASPATSLLPHGGGLVRGGADQFAKWLRRQKPWSELFEEASAALKALGTPLVIVADDIDRLQGNELLEFLKVIRLLGRFPGLSYLLAYDETSLKHRIMAAQAPVSEVAAHEFLEKFVQYPVYLPPLLPGQSLRLLNTALDGILSASGHELTEQDRRLNGIVDEVIALLDTPRAVKRFGAQVSLVLPLHQVGEINVVDLILLTLIRMHFPEIYAALPARRSDLLSREPSLGVSAQREFDWPSLLGVTVNGPHSGLVRTLLETVFPAVRRSGGLSSVRPRASHREYFDRYFVQSIPDDDVSDRAVHEALAAAESGDRAPLAELLTTAVGDRISTAISKLWSFSTGAEAQTRASVALLGAVMSVVPALRGRTTSFFSDRERVLHWAKDLIAELDPAVAASDVFEALREADDVFASLSVLWVPAEIERKLSGGVVAARDLIVGDVLEALIEHLKQRDAASVDTHTVAYAAFLADYGPDRASARIASEIGTGFSAEDYAARFVSLSYLIAENPIPRINGFELRSFQILTKFDDVLFRSAATQSIDEHDISWSNRRAYALGRATLLGPEGS